MGDVSAPEGNWIFVVDYDPNAEEATLEIQGNQGGGWTHIQFQTLGLGQSDWESGISSVTWPECRARCRGRIAATWSGWSEWLEGVI